MPLPSDPNLVANQGKSYTGQHSESRRSAMSLVDDFKSILRAF